MGVQRGTRWSALSAATPSPAPALCGRPAVSACGLCDDVCRLSLLTLPPPLRGVSVHVRVPSRCPCAQASCDPTHVSDVSRHLVARTGACVHMSCMRVCVHVPLRVSCHVCMCVCTCACVCVGDEAAGSRALSGSKGAPWSRKTRPRPGLARGSPSPGRKQGCGTATAGRTVLCSQAAVRARGCWLTLGSLHTGAGVHTHA